jgi:octaprenyl-diphosphate synthase
LDLLDRHGALEATREDALGWSIRAKEALDALPPHEIREMLRDLADYVVERIN